MAAGESLHDQLQESMDSQQWELARDVAYKMLESQPESSWLHTSLGKIFYHLREFEHAEAHLKTAIYHHENHAEAHTYLGQVYLGMKRIGSADDCSKKAISLDGADHLAWSLSFNTKLAYGDIAGAKDCYTTLQRMGAEDGLLSILRFNIIRHPANKETVDHDAEISARKEQLLSDSENYITHAQLAYLYNRFTKEFDLAEKHVQKALNANPADPQIQETAMLIQRKKTLWLRILTAPAQSFTRPDQIDKKEINWVGVVFLSLILVATFGKEDPWMIYFGVFSLIALLFCSYTANLAFQYLARTEVFHRLGKTSLLKAPFRSVHCLPFQKRALVICSLTAMSWIVLGASLYLLTH